MQIPKRDALVLIAWPHHTFLLWWVKETSVKRVDQEIPIVQSDSNS